MSTFLQVLIVLPTYNERENIELLLSAIFNLDRRLHILVVDDNSPDGTADVVEKFHTSHTYGLHLLRRPRKDGLGSAYVAGFCFALKHRYDYICSMDADFSHSPVDLIRLLKLCTEHQADMAIGSRYIAGGRIVNWPLYRILLSYGANRIARALTGITVKDATAGLICYKRTLLEALVHLPIFSTGYSFQVEMKFLAYRRGAKLLEMPIVFANRARGISKMNVKMAGKSFLHLLQMKWYSRAR